MVLVSAKGFVEEMRCAAMRLHTREKAKWDPGFEGYLKFFVDSKLVFHTLERIVENAAFPEYAEFRYTGLERLESLLKDLEWFNQQGHAIPVPSPPGIIYAQYLNETAEKDPQAFLCHFYNTYFAHWAGGRKIGGKVAGKLLDGKELEFYKWDGDLSQLLLSVEDKLNKVGEGWSREEKDHCLEETEKSFKFLGDILRLIVS